VRRIAQIVGYGTISSGVPQTMLNYCRYIGRDKYEFHFIFYKDSPYCFEKELSEIGAKLIKANLFDLLKVFRREKYDIVHSSLNALSVFVMFFAWFSGVRVRVNHSHSTMGKGEPLKNIIKSILNPFSKLFTTHLFACSNHAGKWLFGNSQFTVFRNAIDTQKFAFNHTIRNEIRRELDINEDTFVLGHIGRFEPQKNHKFLMEIFGELQKIKPDSILVLVGEGSLRKKIQKIANSNVKFLGARDDVYRIYNVFDAFILPSLYEGLPIVGVEAQANGLPCFFSKEITEEAGVVDCVNFVGLDESAEKWRQGILAGGDIDRANYSQKVKDAGYDIKIEAKKLEEFYEGVV
jgi:glycosyltransferase EpsF